MEKVLFLVVRYVIFMQKVQFCGIYVIPQMDSFTYWLKHYCYWHI